MSMSELIETKDWYFTFGIGHKYARHYVKITAPYMIARDWMFRKYGRNWAFQYGEDKFDEAIARWNYKMLEHITEEPQITDDGLNINKIDE